MCILMLGSCGDKMENNITLYIKSHLIYHGTTDQLINQFTYKGLRSKTSNAILTLKNSLSVSDINSVKQLLQTVHSLCRKLKLGTNS